MINNYHLGSIVVMKKNHACGSNKWVVTRVGVDIKIKCLNCNHEVMLDRLEFNKKIKKVLGDEDGK